MFIRVAQAGRAVRAVGVGRPLTVPVAQRGNDLIPIAVLAAGAGMGRVALLRAGWLRGLCGVVMPQSGLLRIDAVVAAAACRISRPANFGAGGRLRVVHHVVVAQHLAVVFVADVAHRPGFAGRGAAGVVGVFHMSGFVFPAIPVMLVDVV